RRPLHAASLRALAPAGRPPVVNPHAELAHHASAAGDAVPLEESVGHLVEVGTRALHDGWFADAARFLRRALELCDGPTEQQAPIAVAWAEAAWKANDVVVTKAAAASLLHREDAWRVVPGLATDAAVLHASFCTTGAVDHTSLAFINQGLHQVDDPRLAAR